MVRIPAGEIAAGAVRGPGGGQSYSKPYRSCAGASQCARPPGPWRPAASCQPQRPGPEPASSSSPSEADGEALCTGSLFSRNVRSSTPGTPQQCRRAAPMRQLPRRRLLDGQDIAQDGKDSGTHHPLRDWRAEEARCAEARLSRRGRAGARPGQTGRRGGRPGELAGGHAAAPSTFPRAAHSHSERLALERWQQKPALVRGAMLRCGPNRLFPGQLRAGRGSLTSAKLRPATARIRSVTVRAETCGIDLGTSNSAVGIIVDGESAAALPGSHQTRLGDHGRVCHRRRQARHRSRPPGPQDHPFSSCLPSQRRAFLCCFYPAQTTLLCSHA